MAQYQWNYTFPDGSASFVVQDAGNNTYTIVSATGTVAGGYTITGLGTTHNPDNTLYSDQNHSFDFGFSQQGVSLTISDGTPASAGYQYHLSPVSVITQTPGGGFSIRTEIEGTVYDANGTSVSRADFVPTYTNNVPAACFLAGTRIAVPGGEVAVEALAAGDLVVTAAGETRTVRWVGRSIVRPLTKTFPEHVLPVRIRAGAVAPGVPARDLLVSPGHAVLVHDGFANAGDLLNGRTIVQEEAELLDYYHVELDSHNLLLADGLPAESYVEEENRGTFTAAGGALALHSDLDHVGASRTRAVLARDDEALLRIRERLSDRAEELGWSLPVQPRPELAVGEAVLQPCAVAGDRYWFALPAGTAGALRLLSPARRCDLVEARSTDRRMLGVAVVELRIDGRSIALDSAVLGDGFYGLEADDQGSWRWTDGAAVLHLAAPAAMIELRIDKAMPTPVFGGVADRAAA